MLAAVKVVFMEPRLLEPVAVLAVAGMVGVTKRMELMGRMVLAAEAAEPESIGLPVLVEMAS